jgi:hypothetical protein
VGGIFLTFPYNFSLPPAEGKAGAAWHLPEDLTRSHHDEGRFPIPLHIEAIADPEPLARILDTDLGRYMIIPFGRTTAPFDGDNLVSFFEVAASSRRELLCLPCVQQHHRQESSKPCSCTLRRHFLDRWTRVPCHLNEAKQEAQMGMARIVFDPKEPHGHVIVCRCGTRITQDDDYEAICLWCGGPIVETNGEDGADDDDAKDFKNNEEENAGPAPTDPMAAHTLVPVDDKDGTMAVFQRCAYWRRASEPLYGPRMGNRERCRCPVLISQVSYSGMRPPPPSWSSS